MMGWQPIETAPRDGTWVLLKGGTIDTEGYAASATGTLPPMVAARWDEWGAWFYGWSEGWWRCHYENPTHWLPLPPT